MDFTKCKFKRELFEPVNRKENELPDREIPGPGTYEEKTVKKVFHAKCNTSAFISKVPNCKNLKSETVTPGPGTYDKQRSLSSDTPDLNFLSTTERQGWDNDISQPFTRATNRVLGPGPCAYQRDAKQRSPYNKHSVEPIRNTAFNSSQARVTSMHVRNLSSPGPGQYIDPNDPGQSSVTHKLVKYSREKDVADSLGGQKSAPFGSDQKDRFEKGIFGDLDTQ